MWKSGTQRELGHSDTRKTIRHSGSWALEGLEKFYLADSQFLDDYQLVFKECNHLRATFSKIDEIEVFLFFFIKINLKKFFRHIVGLFSVGLVSTFLKYLFSFEMSNI